MQAGGRRIVRTRQPMQLPSTTSHHGILDPRSGRMRLTRHRPAPDLAYFVERHWVVRWDLRGREPYLQETLPHPSVNLVIEAGRSAVHGVGTERFGHLLEGAGQVVGTKFRPGGFHPFVRFPMVELTDASMALGEAFGPDGDALERAVLASADDREQIRLVESFLRARLPEQDEHVATIARIVRLMLDDPGITRVEDLTARFGMSARTLQRLFRRYVGVSPKWVLKRYRLHEAAERIADGRGDWAALAVELGYFDQAHFIEDFKALVGRSPAEYAAACARIAGAA
jgi:AraC-like DNA-binding protein